MSKKTRSVFVNRTTGRSINRGDRIWHESGEGKIHVTGWCMKHKTLFGGWDNVLTSIPFSELAKWNLELKEFEA